MLCNSRGAELATFVECAKNNTKIKEKSTHPISFAFALDVAFIVGEVRIGRC